MVSSMCGGNQVRSTKTSVSCLQSSMVVGVSWSGAAWVLPALWSYSSLREPWMPTCTVTYWSRAWSPPFGDWVRPSLQHDNDHCLAKEAEGKGDGRAKHVSRPKPHWASVGHPQMEGGGAQVSNIHQLCDVVMEEWKRTPVATCEALVNSMPKRVKAVLENNGGHTKYLHFEPNLDSFT